MLSFLGLRARIGAPCWAAQARTHVSRAAKKVSEKQQVNGEARELTSKKRNLRSETLASPGKAAPPGEAAPPAAAADQKAMRAKALFPKFMRNYAAKINGAPVSSIVSFLIVHELSAVVPLFGLWGAFYYFEFVPIGVPDVVLEEGGKFIRRMAERNNWETLAHAEHGSRVILQGAASYFVVKAILPARLIFSLWAMPWFAQRFVIPVSNLATRASKSLFTKKRP